LSMQRPTMQRQLPVLSGNTYTSAPALVPLQYTQGNLSYSQVTAIVKAHWKLSIFIFLAITALTFTIVKLLPKSYTAQATVLVNYEANDPSRQVPAELFASYMLTQMELIQSRDVLLAVIERLGLTQDPEFVPATTDGIATPTDWAEKNLRASLNIDQGKGIELLYVSATSKDRNKAALIANAVIDVYQTRERDRARDPRSGRAYEYSQQLRELKSKLEAAEAKMAEFRQRTGLTDVSAQNLAQNDVETQALSGLEQQLLQAQNQRRQAESKSSGDQSVSSGVLTSVLIQNLKNQLATLQSQLAQLSATLGPQHPKVLELQSQIAATKHSLSQEVQTFGSGSTADVATAKQVEEKMQRAVEAQRAKVVTVRKMQDEGQKLQLELESAQTVYKRALDGYDQIMFASASVVSRANPPVTASKPNKVLLMALGGVFGVLLGILGPLGYELLFSRRLRCRDDVEREFGIPVLAEFERIPRFT
jgi:succinoglycan biosynthesis transport protein ExoP